MAASDVPNFVLSLAAAIAAAAGLTLGRDLFAHQAYDKTAGPVFTVLRVYGGPSFATFAGNRRGSASVQVDTRGLRSEPVLAQGYQVYEALLDDQDRPRMHWVVPGKVLDDSGAVADDVGGDWEVRAVRFVSGVPGITGRDEDKRYQGAFSFDVEFDRA